ncbi:putative regulator of chromosome condensation (RCC1) repeat [Lyophyllum shimeji]|uniref:Regulator of chromosome condensation (RCC1) repeat n=1 Tax=Lyophyllum shimeji TaxID=47721 RepID=A0A9P3UQL2_LYOSH|nr:putative regulator of chromosome condensation (RCC1) repeat [Lyophyllum shimeji]
MTLLHDYFHLRNQQAFQRLLDGSAERGPSGGALSTSNGRSWTRPSPLASGAVCDVNARDWLGRTVLHLACASLDTVEYVRLLLRHPAINVNIADSESHWTPLHRALYHANFPAALLLLQRSDTDRSLKDLEGYTAFDLYNSTLNGTKPNADSPHADLYTWGANRNATLGFADGGDRVHPEQIMIQKKDSSAEGDEAHLLSRFFPISVRHVQMSKLHTAVITSECGGTLQLCGFGSGGRLGPGHHTQYSLKPLPQLPHTVVAVALGQDHTLAITKAGEVFSWGLNRFSQLGYIIEAPAAGESHGRTEEPIQSVPKKILGPLKKEAVRGVAACKTASVCWTETDVYTWGTNNGQLGYDKAAQAVQILPRKATKVTQPVIDITITDSAMACLLVSQDVICIWNDRHMKIMFPGHAFPSEMQPYRPPQAIQDAKIAKITSSDDMFAALSFNGELFTWSVADPSEASAASAKERSGFKPQRVWALRKKFSAVKDVALGSDGSIIVCTESGHVFVRSRNLKSGQTSSSGKAFKFQKTSSLQRVTHVYANSTGAFGALRREYQIKPVDVCGNTLEQDLAEIQPYLKMHVEKGADVSSTVDIRFASQQLEQEDDMDDLQIQGDIRRLRQFLDVLGLQQKALKRSGGSLATSESRFPHGSDVTIQLPSGFTFPAHRVILAARSRVVQMVLDGSPASKKGSPVSLQLLDPKSTILLGRERDQPIYLRLSGCQPISVFILLTFLYTDEILAPWDHRVAAVLERPLKALKINPEQARTDLRALAELLELPTLAATLESPIKALPSPSLKSAMQRLFDSSQDPSRNKLAQSVLAPDVILQLSDRDVYCYSVILRARSSFFANFFDEEVWTVKRWDERGVLRVDMKHLNWRVMDFVLRFMCFGDEEAMFESLEFVNTVDEALEFMFDVMAAANELLLDRLVLLCSAVILQHTNIHNACFVLADATHLHAQQLIERVQSFITVNMELFLEAGMLEDIPISLVRQLARFAGKKQAEKSPVSRSDRLIDAALTKHGDWLALQDIPTPIVRSHQAISRKESATLKLTPIAGPSGSPRLSPSIRPDRSIRRPPSSDDIFAMDDADMPPSLIADHSQDPSSLKKPPSAAPSLPATPASSVWKAASIPRVDMKAVMAEAANATAPRRPNDAARASPSAHLGTSRSQQVDLRRAPSGQSPSQAGPSLRPTPAGWRTASDQARPSPPATPPRVSSSKDLSATPSPSIPRRSSGPTPTVPCLGPVITPTRQAPSTSTTPSSSTIRRTSGKAWGQPPAQMLPSPAQPTTGMSFAEIQRLQLDQLAGAPGKDKRSLREIQEEERALQAEADFLTWWTAEEERIRLETQLAEEAMAQSAAEAAGRKQAGEGGRKRGRRKADQAPGQGKAPATQASAEGQGQGGQRQTVAGSKRKQRKQSQRGEAAS